MPMPTLTAPLARAAYIIEAGHAVRKAVCSWGYDLTTAKAVDGAVAAVTDGIFDMMSQRGAILTSPGVIQPAAQTSQHVPPDVDLLRPAAPDSHMLSVLLRACAQAGRDNLVAGSSQRDKTRLASAGGAGAGKSLVAPAGLQAAHFSDEHFTEILRWRLGCRAPGEPGRCRNFAASTGEPCEAKLDCHGDHAAGCSYGPLRIRRHNAYADCLSDMIAETGAHVRREAYVKAFATPEHGAWLDIWAFGSIHIQDLLVDVTIRHPMADAYQPHAAEQPGYAAGIAEHQKPERYPEKDGRSVVPFAVETWGRLGECRRPGARSEGRRLARASG